MSNRLLTFAEAEGRARLKTPALKITEGMPLLYSKKLRYIMLLAVDGTPCLVSFSTSARDALPTHTGFLPLVGATATAQNPGSFRVATLAAGSYSFDIINLDAAAAAVMATAWAETINVVGAGGSVVRLLPSAWNATHPSEGLPPLQASAELAESGIVLKVGEDMQSVYDDFTAGHSYGADTARSAAPAAVGEAATQKGALRSGRRPGGIAPPSTAPQPGNVVVGGGDSSARRPPASGRRPALQQRALQAPLTAPSQPAGDGDATSAFFDGGTTLLSSPPAEEGSALEDEDDALYAAHIDRAVVELRAQANDAHAQRVAAVVLADAERAKRAAAERALDEASDRQAAAERAASEQRALRSAAEARSAESASTLDRLTREAAAAKQQLETLAAARAAADDRAAALELELTRCRADAAAVQGELRAAQDERRMLQGELLAALEERRALQAEARAAQEERQETAARAELLAKELAELRSAALTALHRPQPQQQPELAGRTGGEASLGTGGEAGLGATGEGGGGPARLSGRSAAAARLRALHVPGASDSAAASSPLQPPPAEPRDSAAILKAIAATALSPRVQRAVTPRRVDAVAAPAPATAAAAAAQSPGRKGAEPLQPQQQPQQQQQHVSAATPSPLGSREAGGQESRGSAAAAPPAQSLENLLGQLKSAGSDAPAVAAACSALHTLLTSEQAGGAESAQLRLACVQAGGVQAVVTALAACGPGSAEAAAAAAALIADLAPAAVGSGGALAQHLGALIPPLIAVLAAHGARSKAVAEATSAALRALAASSDAKAAFSAQGGVRVLLVALSSHVEELGVIEQACGALRVLAANAPDTKKVALEAGGIPLLVRALSHCSSSKAGTAESAAHSVHAAATQAAGALRTCIGSTDSQAAAMAAGAVPVAVNALGSLGRDPMAVEQVCGVLRNVAAKQPANRAAIGAAGGVRALVAALAGLVGHAGCPPSAVEQACGALWNAVADSPPNAAEAGAHGAADLLARAGAALPGTGAAATAANALAQLTALLPT